MKVRLRNRTSLENDGVGQAVKGFIGGSMMLDEGASISLGVRETGELERDRQNVPPEGAQVPEVNEVERVRVVHEKDRKRALSDEGRAVPT